MVRLRDRIRGSVGVSYPRIAVLFGVTVLLGFVPEPLGVILTVAFAVVMVVLLSGLLVAMRGTPEGRLFTGVLIVMSAVFASIALWAWLGDEHALALSTGANALFIVASLAVAAQEA